MSAAAPLPPPGPRATSAMNGYTHGGHANGADAWRGGGGAGEGRAPGGPFPSVAEIAASVDDRLREMQFFGIGRLIEEGKASYTQAKFYLNARNPAGAWWAYLLAFQIVVTAIPRHPDFIDRIDKSRGGMYRDFKQLRMGVEADENQFKNVKEIIKHDNLRNGPQAAPAQFAARPASFGSQFAADTDPYSHTSRLSNGSIRRDDELMLPDVPSAPPSRRDSPAAPPDSPRRKPYVQPKPQSLHGRALHQSSSSISGPGGDELAERFARLRGPSTTVNTASASDLSVKMPSPSEYATSKPLGPRAMQPPSHLPKLPLNTELAASLPKEPSPTYSPARNMSLPNGMNAPRSSARSIVGTGGRSNSIAASSVSSFAPGTNGDSDSYFPVQTDGHAQSLARRRSSVGKPLELQIPAEKLYDYIRMFNVLLIDVRSREDYDAGHIYVNQIVCVEPTALREGYSAEQLQDRLIVSPDEELAYFDKRNEFDLVVYYDECTKTSSFLTKYNRNEKETALKRLYDTLYEFNLEKPLKRPPIFLMGGLDAWADLVGTQALKMSTTAALVASGQTRPARPIKRVPAASHNSRINMQKRRVRSYTTMDAEEEQRWREEARRGRTVFEHTDEFDDEDEPTSPVYRTTEDFLRRFPEVELGQQSMVYPPSRPPPPPGQQVAPYYPPAPSRPAPSVPRVSYSGVHERQVAPQGRSNQLAMYVSPGRHGQIRLHKTGLINFGVTCYMNSVIQCLCANTDLTNIFLMGGYAKDLQRDNWKGTKGIIPEAYATLVSNLYKGDISSIRPSTFRRLCGMFGQQWAIDEQQDSKEFLEFFLDCLHEDLNVTWNRTPLKQLTEAEELTREKLPRPYVAKIEWERYLHRDTSIISSLFAGQHASRLTCDTCGTTSTTYEAFWSISVEIPRDRPADLRDCLRSYCSTESLTHTDTWRCPRCKQDREAKKKITITRAPDYLVMHFKRFSASHGQSARKILTPINFPLQGLDLGPFMEPQIDAEEEAYLAKRWGEPNHTLQRLKSDPAMNGPYIYNAYAVIWHLGSTLSSGHYIAAVKDKSKGCWRQFNDDKVRDFQPGNLATSDRLQNEKAYIVFYERERVAGSAF
ncbi:cysteine proteinase [Amniculicola lignicola CBS 123094]|uniref:Cysteine proteinase n=1 Tax=Amniculicola lignicola CBS 123094 TaxID=1392246 RepID=A0A6A5W614_9PLEO|nr:cysteine proteinase [Amniculicola lignicola CBS 123094]